MTQAVLAFLWRAGITVFTCLDDWLVLGSLESEARNNTLHMLHTLHDLGWVVNKAKS